MEDNYNTGGIGFVGLLQIVSITLQFVFITLKLLRMISWSWVWVLSPTWIRVLVVVIIKGVLYVIVLKKKYKK